LFLILHGIGTRRCRQKIFTPSRLPISCALGHPLPERRRIQPSPGFSLHIRLFLLAISGLLQFNVMRTRISRGQFHLFKITPVEGLRLYVDNNIPRITYPPKSYTANSSRDFYLDTGTHVHYSIRGSREWPQIMKKGGEKHGKVEEALRSGRGVQ